ncbi:hypothetical protein [Halomarina ordinaria]|uniref:Uncharacterized protein n=1 Tax=Halomarina ordinaria TaxID=3033939 RepID=A0ABD5U4A6_9EURY|nr:hypothetical protein [Halomarina sp. PSRA2]
MSSRRQRAATDRGQQTLDEAIKSRLIHEPVVGAVPRVELPDVECEAFIETHHCSRSVLISLDDARRAINRNEWSEVLTDYHIPITTATEKDGITTGRSMDEVLRILEVIQPAIHVPDVSFAYGYMDDLTIAEVADAYVEYVVELSREINDRDYDIRLMPTQKGWTTDHFEPYRRLREDYGITDYAFYCGQSIGGHAGNALHKDRREARTFITTVDPENVMLIGRMSPDELRQFEPRVTSAAGLNYWRTRCQTSSGYSYRQYRELDAEIDQALKWNHEAKQSNLRIY